MEFNGTTYNDETELEVINAIEQARHSDQRYRFFYGDTKTGQSWFDEWGMTGRVGRSTGSSKIPLIVCNARSLGGAGMLDHCIIGIRSKAGWIYKHPTFKTGRFEIIDDNEQTNLKSEVRINGKIHAQFRNHKQAEKWVRFMSGESFGK